MLLSDYHVHCDRSMDSTVSMTDMVLAAAGRGVGAMCFTDHCDFDIPESMQLENFRITEAEHLMLAEARAVAPKDMFIGLGLELGEPNRDPERACSIYAMEEFDFILGSLHNLKGYQDFYFMEYESLEHCMELYDLYVEELIDIAKIPCFDTMAHVGYCLRYMSAAGYPEATLDLNRHGDRLRVLFRTLIENGRGIELNCADFAKGGRSNALGVTIPTLPILKLYKEMGGEIITVGSDGHTTKASGLGITEGYDLLRETGFKYVSMFKKHKLEMITL